ncbi:UDP-2,3-diacylglucosamine diphosphatase [Sphingobacterium spiritivorum]|uniref:UDP-2,3-diacylglucosamine diphosphatase n=1 Tax=Sphingobacterium spiritivorum TaxID=258 RepID=UPI003DA3ED23
MSDRKNIYFASDFHLGSYPEEKSIAREHEIVNWLNHIKSDAKELYLMGDVFDFWFEYRSVVPKGYIRFLGKLAELADEGVKITFFKGNHDMWMFGYLRDQLGANIIDNELEIIRDGKSFYLHHGDGLGDGDQKYKILKKIFRSKACQWLFARLHPNLGIGIAQRWSRSSRVANDIDEIFLGEDKEWLIQYARQLENTQHFDFYIFGHRHLSYYLPLSSKSQIINLGEWFKGKSYAVWNGTTLELLQWNNELKPE